MDERLMVRPPVSTGIGLGTRLPCLFCLSPGTLIVRKDKKDRPFLKCAGCGVVVFLGPLSWRGVQMLFGPLYAALRKGDSTTAIGALGVALEGKEREEAAGAPPVLVELSRSGELVRV